MRPQGQSICRVAGLLSDMESGLPIIGLLVFNLLAQTASAVALGSHKVADNDGFYLQHIVHPGY